MDEDDLDIEVKSGSVRIKGSEDPYKNGNTKVVIFKKKTQCRRGKVANRSQASWQPNIIIH